MKARKGTDERSKLIRALDRITPTIVKLRDGYTCQWCGQFLQVGLREWAHIFRRGHLMLRWLPDNAITACHECHDWLDLHRIEKEGWFSAKFPARWALIEAVHRQPAFTVRSCTLSVMLDENKIELERLEVEFK